MRYVLLLMLSGCAGFSDQGSQHAAYFAGACKQIGYTAGTKDFQDCQVRLMDAQLRGATR